MLRGCNDGADTMMMDQSDGDDGVYDAKMW